MIGLNPSEFNLFRANIKPPKWAVVDALIKHMFEHHTFQSKAQDILTGRIQNRLGFATSAIAMSIFKKVESLNGALDTKQIERVCTVLQAGIHNFRFRENVQNFINKHQFHATYNPILEQLRNLLSFSGGIHDHSVLRNGAKWFVMGQKDLGFMQRNRLEKNMDHPQINAFEVAHTEALRLLLSTKAIRLLKAFGFSRKSILEALDGLSFATQPGGRSLGQQYHNTIKLKDWLLKGASRNSMAADTLLHEFLHTLLGEDEVLVLLVQTAIQGKVPLVYETFREQFRTMPIEGLGAPVNMDYVIFRELFVNAAAQGNTVREMQHALARGMSVLETTGKQPLTVKTKTAVQAFLATSSKA